MARTELLARSIHRPVKDITGFMLQLADTVSKNVADLSKSSAQTCAGIVRVIRSARSLADPADGLSGETDRT
ncbi:hypothetical protein A6A05_08970 [Magnetospirillum moscoviense]|uniref:Uncharacterized protein n=1 Tax=Magnetospirillum moscoviense TaxID=1437059 RepID=A0A178MVI5_9PROT|nr:hypothetical protein A6A05_08970 [Magnetospirillum moscoviense]